MILPQRECQSDGKWMGGMEFEESFLEESCHTTAAQPTHHWGKCPFRPSQFTGLTAWLPRAGVRDHWCLNVAGEKEQVGAACGRAGFRGKSTIKVLKLKGITIILPCGQHAPESFFCGSAPKRKWRAQSRGSQKRACMPWDVEKVKRANLNWAGFLTSGKPQE